MAKPRKPSRSSSAPKPAPQPANEVEGEAEMAQSEERPPLLDAPPPNAIPPSDDFHFLRIEISLHTGWIDVVEAFGDKSRDYVAHFSHSGPNPAAAFMRAVSAKIVEALMLGRSKIKLNVNPGANPPEILAEQ